MIYSFQTGNDRNSPISNLVRDAAGNLYGATSEGGLGSGAIFKLAPTGGGQWTESVVHPFAGPPDGGFSYNGMVVDRFGNFYGATVHGRTNDDGCVLQVHALTQQRLGTRQQSIRQTLVRCVRLHGCITLLVEFQKCRLVILSNVIIYTPKRELSIHDCTQCLNGNRWDNNGETLLTLPYFFRSLDGL